MSLQRTRVLWIFQFSIMAGISGSEGDQDVENNTPGPQETDLAQESNDSSELNGHGK